MALSDTDRGLLQRCLSRQDTAWNDFVERFLALVAHVVIQTAATRSIRLTPHDKEDLVADVFVEIVKDDFHVLRRFQGKSSLATYLTVVSRRVVVRELLRRKWSTVPTGARAESGSNRWGADFPDDANGNVEERLSNREEVEQLLRHLHGPEAEVIRLYHLEGKSYQEISSSVGMPENSIGPTLSRARAKIRSAAH